MKNLILTSLILLGFAIQGNAGNAPTSINIVEQGKKVILQWNNNQAVAEEFTILDAKGEVVFSEKLDRYDFGVKYDLNHLPSGSYRLKISGDNFVEFHNATIADQFLSIENEEVYFKPSVQDHDDKIVVNSLSTTTEDIKVTIFDQYGEVVFDYSERQNGAYQKAFDLKNLNKGQYVVYVTTGYFSESSKISL